MSYESRWLLLTAAVALLCCALAAGPVRAQPRPVEGPARPGQADESPTSPEGGRASPPSPGTGDATPSKAPTGEAIASDAAAAGTPSGAGAASLEASPRLARKGGALRLTLEKAVKIAREKNLELKSARVSIKAAEQSVRAAWGGLGPHITIAADFNFMGGDTAFEGGGGEGTTFCEDFTDPECQQQLAELMCGTTDINDDCVQFLMTSQGQNTAQILGNTLGATMGGFGDIGKIFQANTFSPSITAVWPLFNAQAIVGIKQAQLGKRMTRLQVENKSQDVTLRVQVAYYQILQFQEMVMLSEQNMRSTEAHLKQAKALKAAGEATRTDVLRWEAQLEQNRLETLKASLGVTQVKMLLNNLLGRDLRAGLELVAPKELAGALPTPERIEASDVEKHPQLKLAEAATKGKHLEYRRAQSRFLPTLTLTAQYSWQRYIQYLNVVPDEWLGSWMVGLSLKVPIFDSLIDYHSVRSKSYELSRSRIDERNVRRMLLQQLYSARQDLISSRQEVATATKQVKLAVAAHESAENLYKAGAAKTTDLLDAQIRESQAKANLIRARYDYLIALARLRRAAGRL